MSPREVVLKRSLLDLIRQYNEPCDLVQTLESGSELQASSRSGIAPTRKSMSNTPEENMPTTPRMGSSLMLEISHFARLLSFLASKLAAKKKLPVIRSNAQQIHSMVIYGYRPLGLGLGFVN